LFEHTDFASKRQKDTIQSSINRPHFPKRSFKQVGPSFSFVRKKIFLFVNCHGVKRLERNLVG